MSKVVLNTRRSDKILVPIRWPSSVLASGSSIRGLPDYQLSLHFSWNKEACFGYLGVGIGFCVRDVLVVATNFRSASDSCWLAPLGATGSPLADLRAHLSGRRVALVHEWLSSFAGSEQTFLAMAEMFPDAELFAMSHNRKRSFDFGRPVKVSFLDPLLRNGGRGAVLPLMPLAMRHLARRHNFDVVITSSHAFSRAFLPQGRSIHLSYTYAPARYLWMAELERHRSRLPAPEVVRRPLRHLDRKLAGRVDHFAAISTEIADRIRRFYDRDANVVYPPVDTDFFTPGDCSTPRAGALAVSRLVPYKAVDLAIEACARAGVPLTVIGSGPEQQRLEARSRCLGAATTFLGSVSRAELRDAYRSARVVVFPALEDFGIVPVEAQACGAAVVALDQGGSRETVRRTPWSLVPDADPELFAEAIGRTLDQPDDPSAWRAHAERFSREAFQTSFSSWAVQALRHGSHDG